MKKVFISFISFIFLFGCSTNNGVTTVVPAAPTNLSATVTSITQVNLTWTDNSTNESGYKIQRKTGVGNFSDVGSTGSDIAAFTDMGLTANTTYTYRVYAFNSAGNSLQYSNEVSVTTNLVPIITTLAISDTTINSAKSGGNITSDAGSPVTARGVCWSTTSGPTVSLTTKTNDGTGTGNFNSNITGLTANTSYYVRAYATNLNGTAYGNEVSFTTLNLGSIFNPNLTYGSVSDVDGNVYRTIQIGSQTWMAENLRTTKYRDGSNIPVITSNSQWANNWNNGNQLQQPMMCWYGNDQTTYTANKFGALYNWYAINPTTNGNKNVCPSGWHIPTDAEWTALTNFLGGESVAGGKMKSIGLQYWLSPNQSATNSSGFSGLPSSLRGVQSGAFSNIGNDGYWWSSTEVVSGSGSSWGLNLSNLYSSARRSNYDKSNGFSVRCIKD